MQRALLTKIRTAAAAAAAASLALVSLVAAPIGQRPLAREQAGAWRTGRQQLDASLTAADRTAFPQGVSRILDVLKRAPRLSTPKGFDVVASTFANLDRLDSAVGRPQIVMGSIHIDLACYELGSRGPVANDQNAAGSIDIKINDLSFLTGGTVQDGYVTFGDDQGDFIKGSHEPDDTLHGLPVYESGNDHWIVMRPPNVPLLAPVSRERYIKFRRKKAQASIDHAEANLAKLPQNNPQLAGPVATAREAIAQLRALVSALDAELAGMSAADRAAPAFVTSGSDLEAPHFETSADSGAEAIQTLNPALQSGPRGAPQILAVSIRAEDDHWPDLARQLDEQIDWSALAAVVQARAAALSVLRDAR